jgi:hypothetical protein
MFAIFYIKAHYWEEFVGMFITCSAKLIYMASRVQ